MPLLRSGLVLAATQALACSSHTPVGSPGGAPAVSPAPTELPLPAPSELPAAEVLHAASGDKAAWPDDAIDGVHGWWALGGGEVKASEAAVVVDTSWNLPPGTSLKALTTDGLMSVEIRPKESGVYGCDDMPLDDITPVAGAPAAEMVWMVSPTYQDATALPLKTVQTERRRTWSADGVVLGLDQVGPLTLTLWHGDPGTVLETLDLATMLPEQFHEDGASVADTTFVPQARAAWRIGGVVVVGFSRHSLEGRHYEALVIREGVVTKAELGSLYYCAF